ncbi:glycosyltransferase [Rossellomorea aquimaris]|uniref:4,4'-diaponeurosporenoate glycosyltransferase n=1 Tax=Rossellomorea aquimaris TaxID=189382 RepID=A0A366EZ42_9BACI|nr:glycosyltransferase [Rossellomorea aquimaris]RBP07671.1 cellulose synthase/poly-beta-1,6-N-acetylglucosamine synthase-like glycosyltransferase [Rossellomorea aquimaris]
MISLLILLYTVLAVWLVLTIDVWRGLSKLSSIQEFSYTVQGPLLSVIVPARNEEDTITDSILSQLKQDYHQIEWILVNDRSTDGTPEKLEALAELDKRISVLHIDSLEQGWLGKNKALYKGYQMAKGDLILFTDADIIFKDPTILSRAVSFLHSQKLDHVTLAPNIRSGSFWLKSFVAFFLFGFSFYKRPWKANDPSSKTGMGIGAFNLITRPAYEEIGTHEAIKDMPDDDLQLGVQIKKHHKKQFFLTALQHLEVEWYRSLKEAFNGLEKNTFAGLHYSMLLVVFAMFGIFCSTVLPFITIFSASPPIRIVSLLIILFIGITYFKVIKQMTNESPLLFLALPVTALLFIYSIGRATFLTFKRGGIEWRGTVYSYKELKQRRK